jgi:mono/diheme cytochrome c family protein
VDVCTEWGNNGGRRVFSRFIVHPCADRVPVIGEGSEIMPAIQRAIVLAVILGPAGLSLMRSASTPAPRPQAADDRGQIDRGRYLVEEVARCPECHTPRNAQGELERQRWLQGAAIWITPVRPVRNWGQDAPALAGFPGYSDEQGERILEQGMGAQGEMLRPPMHTYHLTKQDAKAIIAYLRSLPRS